MIAMMEEITGNIAAEGNAVIVGRGSPYFLREREDTFSVFTYAPHDEKIRRLLAMGKSREEAEELVENVDKERIAYIKHYFNHDWPTRSLYHLMITVIVGRGSPYFLREREDTFRVFTYAPHDEKIRRLLAMGRSREEAEELVENVDKERIAYIKHYFNADWPTRSFYHLMINTVVGDENVIATILNGMRTLEARPVEAALRSVR